MTGFMSYISKDKVWPVDKNCSYFTSLLMITTSLFVLVFTVFSLCGKIVQWFVAVIYLVSLINTVRIHHLCRSTEPGILPRIRSKKIDYNKTYHVRYRKKEKVLQDNQFENLTTTQQEDEKAKAFFSTFKFELVENVSKEEEKSCQPLAFCSTCKIIRPPRSFHCSECGVCIENHDHHCPWIGICIGRRNTRYFVLYLFFMTLHAFMSAVLCILFATIESRKKLVPLLKTETKDGKIKLLLICHFLNIFAGVFALQITCTVASFCQS